MNTPPIEYARSADGTDIACIRWGDGPPLISVPSLGMTIAASFDGTRMQIAPLLGNFERGYFDRRGTGSSGSGQPATSELLVQDCLAAVEHIGFPSFHVWGNRFGQFEAVHLALAFPERVRGLVLNSPYGRDWAGTPRAKAWRAALDEDWDWFAETFFGAWGKSGAGQAMSDDLVQRFKQTNNPEGFGAVFRTLAAWDLTEDLKRLRVPTLIIHKAAAAWGHPMEWAASFAQSIPNARLILDHHPDLIPLTDETEEALRRFFIETMPAAEVPRSWHENGHFTAAGTASGLSEREQEILKLVAVGFSNQEIAGALFLAAPTVASHIRHILDKVGVQNRAAAAAWAVREGLAQ